MKKLFLVIILAASVSNTYAADKKTETKGAASADSSESFVCTVDIYSSWLPAPVAPPIADVAQKGKKAVSETPPEPPKPIEEFFQTFREVSPTEQTAKDKLNAKVPSFLADAQKNCEAKHQALASCFASKAKAFSTEYQMLDFDGRRAFLDSVREDCKQVAGKCVSNRASDIACRKEMIPQVQEAPAKEEKKK